MKSQRTLVRRLKKKLDVILWPIDIGHVTAVVLLIWRSSVDINGFQLHYYCCVTKHY